ncbi:hypothetical protein SIFV0052 [Sulfolobus islandicus filamentous virus]|uniref:Uncharacterized protein 52 n=1 Tax=Sulfolobus islandicus filamentous virus (isolate Iceland/Hveragerdi) TaxID=654908 RepID=Y052_SIFVH|nr:hypothetical protein SIFV0052 [Sulfolobus islandicus filamentous virus]Q914I0.1 RecName: Full=Uncharacterized protein 52 [Sulfolobus islandicus filamentous virus (isolate Hveragerdi)]AAL27761.1 hypothetical protein [Sulfolobus islandicus filamentous virus]
MSCSYEFIVDVNVCSTTYNRRYFHKFQLHSLVNTNVNVNKKYAYPSAGVDIVAVATTLPFIVAVICIVFDEVNVF